MFELAKTKFIFHSSATSAANAASGTISFIPPDQSFKAFSFVKLFSIDVALFVFDTTNNIYQGIADCPIAINVNNNVPVNDSVVTNWFNTINFPAISVQAQTLYFRSGKTFFYDEEKNFRDVTSFSISFQKGLVAGLPLPGAYNYIMNTTFKFFVP